MIEIFQKEIESLGGRGYVASDSADVPNIIADIATHSNSKRAVIQASMIQDEDQIAKELESRGINVTKLPASSSHIETLSKADLAITRADMAVAHSGTLIIKTSEDQDRLMSCFPRIHVAIVSASKIVANLSDAVPYLREHLSKDETCTISLISGPSRTADIEMKQVLGVHGPHEVHVIFVTG
jgi:L-lactate utilization protein LutC